MAIGYDATSSSKTVGPQTSLTFSHTNAGDILFVIATNNSSETVTGIAYATVAMTKITGVDGGYGFLSLWYLLAPAAGANDIVITSSGSVLLAGAASSYTGAKQSGQPDATSTETSSLAASITDTTTTSADNCWVVSGWGGNSATAPTAGANLTARSTQLGGSGQAVGIGDNNAAQTPAGNVTLTWNQAVNSSSAVIQASFSPAPPPAPSTGRSFMTTNTKFFGG